MYITRLLKRMTLTPSYWDIIGSGNGDIRTVGVLEDILWGARFLIIGMLFFFPWVVLF